MLSKIVQSRDKLFSGKISSRRYLDR